jgi:hypothetical protein
VSAVIRLLVHDVLRAVFSMPGQTVFIALAGWVSATLFHMSAYGAWGITWPISGVCFALVLMMVPGALAEPERTDTFLPLLALSGTLGGLFVLARFSVVTPVVVTGLALVRHVGRRRRPAPSFALPALAAVAARVGLDDLPHELFTPTADVLLASYAWLALLLVAFPAQATRGNRRLFGSRDSSSSPPPWSCSARRVCTASATHRRRGRRS